MTRTMSSEKSRLFRTSGVDPRRFSRRTIVEKGEEFDQFVAKDSSGQRVDIEMNGMIELSHGDEDGREQRRRT